MELDFGAGFYLTSSYHQAEKWAKNVAKRRKSGVAIVNKFELNESEIRQLRVLRFSVANDTTLPVIDDYMDGKYSKEEAIKRLMPQNLTDQYAFLTQEALLLLKFEGGERI